MRLAFLRCPVWVGLKETPIVLGSESKNSHTPIVCFSQLFGAKASSYHQMVKVMSKARLLFGLSLRAGR